MIHIKDWVIDADERCYTVGKLKTKTVKVKGVEKTEEYIANPRYYTSLCRACEGILEAERKSIIRDNEMNLTDAIQRLEKVQEEFRKLFLGIE